MDDATSEIYYAQLVEEESTRTVMAALREVIEQQGCFCALYSDRASHFFVTPQAGEPVDRQRLTQVGRALADLRIEMIPSYSPQARGRGERNFQTWQGRLPQELRRQEIQNLEPANVFLRQSYVLEFNRQFMVKSAQPGTAFVPTRRKDLDQVFSIQQERVVNRDNTVSWAKRALQIEKTSWRGTLAGCRVIVCEHLDGRLSILYGPHCVGLYSADGVPLPTMHRQQGQRRTLPLPSRPLGRRSGCFPALPYPPPRPHSVYVKPKADASFQPAPRAVASRRKEKASAAVWQAAERVKSVQKGLENIS